MAHSHAMRPFSGTQKRELAPLLISPAQLPVFRFPIPAPTCRVDSADAETGGLVTLCAPRPEDKGPARTQIPTPEPRCTSPRSHVPGVLLLPQFPSLGCVLQYEMVRIRRAI